jgi:hypothetical protein
LSIKHATDARLKGTKFSTSGIVHESVSPKPLSIPLGPFHDTGCKFAADVVNGCNLTPAENFTAVFSPAGNFPPVSRESGVLLLSAKTKQENQCNEVSRLSENVLKSFISHEIWRSLLAN